MVIKRIFVGVSLAAVLGLLAACSAGTASTPTPVPTSTSTTAPQPTATTQPPGTPASDGAIRFEWNDVSPGLLKTLEISPGGKATLDLSGKPPITWQLSDQRMASLMKQVEAVEVVFELEESYDEGNVLDDTFSTLTLFRGGSAMSVTVASVGGKDIAPQPLRDLMLTLRSLGYEMEQSAKPTVAATPASDTKIVYEQSGGIAGIRKTLQISTDGIASLSAREGPLGNKQLSAAELDALLGKFDEADFFGLEEKYDSGTVADDIYNTITFTQAGRTHTVMVADVGGEGVTPISLLELVEELRGIASRVEGAGVHLQSICLHRRSWLRLSRFPPD